MGCEAWGVGFGAGPNRGCEEADLFGQDLGAGAFARGGEAVRLREDHLKGERGGGGGGERGEEGGGGEERRGGGRHHKSYNHSR